MFELWLRLLKEWLGVAEPEVISLDLVQAHLVLPLSFFGIWPMRIARVGSSQGRKPRLNRVIMNEAGLCVQAAFGPLWYMHLIALSPDPKRRLSIPWVSIRLSTL